MSEMGLCVWPSGRQDPMTRGEFYTLVEREPKCGAYWTARPGLEAPKRRPLWKSRDVARAKLDRAFWAGFSERAAG